LHPPFFLVYEARLSRWTAQPGRKSGALRLKGADFVNILVDGDLVTATTKGEAFGLDRVTGQLLWHNKLPGLGMGFGHDRDGRRFESDNASAGKAQEG